MDAAVKPTTTQQAQKFAGIWEQIYLRDASRFDAPALEHARRALVDTLACIIGGASQQCTRAAALAASSHSAGDVALVLGTASHALDFDDVCMLATCHPSAPVIAALLSQLPHCPEDTTLAQLLRAHLVGTEVMLRLGAWLGFGHYELGFHATGTLGTVGATAAVAHLLALPIDAARTAIAIAASSASGLRANFGTDTKPLHVGFAASAAVRAVALTRAGATANSTAAIAGFARAYSGDAMLALPHFDVDTPWAVNAPGLEIKRYPSCYLTHRMIAGVLKLRASQPDAIILPSPKIDIEFPPGGTIPLQYPQPATGLQGKFSAPYCAAAAWVDGHVSLGSFTDDAVHRGDVLHAMQQVHVHERQGAPEALDTAPVRVSIEGIGSILVDWAPGSLQDPPSNAELLAKWQDCERIGGLSLPPELAEQLMQTDAATPAHELLMPLTDAVLQRN